MKRKKDKLGRICDWAFYGGLSLIALTMVVKVADKKLHSTGAREDFVEMSVRDGYSKRVDYLYTPLFCVAGACVLAGAGIGIARSGKDLGERVR